MAIHPISGPAQDFGPLRVFHPAECTQSSRKSKPAFMLDGLQFPAQSRSIILLEKRSENMQDGSVTVEARKRGPDVWCFRWREPGADGRKIHRRIVLGTRLQPG